MKEVTPIGNPFLAADHFTKISVVAGFMHLE